MSHGRGAFSLHPLLEERRRIEEARLREWTEIDTEWDGMLERIQMLERATNAAHVTGNSQLAARAVAIEWNRTRVAVALRSTSERLRECSQRRGAARSALQAARLDRRVIEKLEERWRAARRRRHARNESAAIEEAAMLGRVVRESWHL